MWLFSKLFGKKKLIESEFSAKRVSIIREFKKPPYGGGNQFMLALKKGFLDLGVDVYNNKVNSEIDAYIFDSSWLDKDLLKKLRKVKGAKIAHRIDGPIQLYRGSDSTADDEIFELNKEFATVTIIQSQFTLNKLLELGYQPVNPVVIHNSINPDIFFPTSTRENGNKIRVVSASWSDNPKKGGSVYKWLDDNLNFDKVQYSFVGRIKEPLKNIKIIPPVDSNRLAEILRGQDIYITASENDPCSNSLIEGLACGLPAIYRNSGGHPELVKDAGLPFNSQEEIPGLIDQIMAGYDNYVGNINVNSITDIAHQYLTAMFQESKTGNN
jgi:glycosyltransferase involved in cell wall biosynthesis